MASVSPCVYAVAPLASRSIPTSLSSLHSAISALPLSKTADCTPFSVSTAEQLKFGLASSHQTLSTPDSIATFTSASLGPDGISENFINADFSSATTSLSLPFGNQTSFIEESCACSTRPILSIITGTTTSDAAPVSSPASLLYSVSATPCSQNSSINSLRSHATDMCCNSCGLLDSIVAGCHHCFAKSLLPCDDSQKKLNFAKDLFQPGARTISIPRWSRRRAVTPPPSLHSHQWQYHLPTKSALYQRTSQIGLGSACDLHTLAALSVHKAAEDQRAAAALLATAAAPASVTSSGVPGSSDSSNLSAVLEIKLKSASPIISIDGPLNKPVASRILDLPTGVCASQEPVTIFGSNLASVPCSGPSANICMPSSSPHLSAISPVIVSQTTRRMDREVGQSDRQKSLEIRDKSTSYYSTSIPATSPLIISNKTSIPGNSSTSPVYIPGLSRTRRLLPRQQQDNGGTNHLSTAPLWNQILLTPTCAISNRLSRSNLTSNNTHYATSSLFSPFVTSTANLLPQQSSDKRLAISSILPGSHVPQLFPAVGNHFGASISSSGPLLLPATTKKKGAGLHSTSSGAISSTSNPATNSSCCFAVGSGYGNTCAVTSSALFTKSIAPRIVPRPSTTTQLLNSCRGNANHPLLAPAPLASTPNSLVMRLAPQNGASNKTTMNEGNCAAESLFSGDAPEASSRPAPESSLSGNYSKTAANALLQLAKRSILVNSELGLPPRQMTNGDTQSSSMVTRPVSCGSSSSLASALDVFQAQVTVTCSGTHLSSSPAAGACTSTNFRSLEIGPFETKSNPLIVANCPNQTSHPVLTTVKPASVIFPRILPRPQVSSIMVPRPCIAGTPATTDRGATPAISLPKSSAAHTAPLVTPLPQSQFQTPQSGAATSTIPSQSTKVLLTPASLIHQGLSQTSAALLLTTSSSALSAGLPIVAGTTLVSHSSPLLTSTPPTSSAMLKPSSEPSSSSCPIIFIPTQTSTNAVRPKPRHTSPVSAVRGRPTPVTLPIEEPTIASRLGSTKPQDSSHSELKQTGQIVAHLNISINTSTVGNGCNFEDLKQVDYQSPQPARIAYSDYRNDDCSPKNISADSSGRTVPIHSSSELSNSFINLGLSGLPGEKERIEPAFVATGHGKEKNRRQTQLAQAGGTGEEDEDIDIEGNGDELQPILFQGILKSRVRTSLSES